MYFNSISSGRSVETTCRTVMEGVSSNVLRALSSEEKEKLTKQDESIASGFKCLKLETEAQKNWDLFYKRNETRFFRDRHWTSREFELLVDIPEGSSKNLLEVGCGVGNFLFPLLEQNAGLYVYACDFSSRAVELVKKDARFTDSRMKVFTCDITKDRYLFVFEYFSVLCLFK